ncbi:MULTISPECIES: FG-GAP and VCBS repeat-containing protein [Actinomadura]|uniref:FG-GAP and VCBS repeat-containing protein n=1 Tax=Actinomadura yumaensis TaxID=111807 RepID=A0ABW2CDQ5_9ACTN|nr:FG-GAP and VCBS repeat-containing protein [Actinomadura sp. J1-007]MWK38180.1 hypothetical protein [Actinomadura sp. J1-007]
MTRRNRGLRTAALATFTALAAGAAGLAGVPAEAAPKAPARPGDFNGDGRRDLALGSPSGTAAGVEWAGFVTVVYGGASGPDSAKRQVITQESPGIPGGSEQIDGFGASLASADFNLDGYADLAVVADAEDYQGPGESGRITLIYGGSGGLTSKAVAFGKATSVSAGDFDHDGRPDLAAARPGAFTVFRNLASGDLTGTDTRYANGTGETITVTTTAADLTGDGYADLAVGLVWPPVDGEGDLLRLNVYKGSADGVATTPAFTTSDLSVRSLASGDVNGDGRADLVAGVHTERGGEVRVLPGAPGGVGAATVIDQDTDGVPGTQESDDAFGSSVAVGDVNGDGKADVAAGAPEEKVGGTLRAGAATVLYGGPGGVTGASAQQFGQGTAGMPGSVEQDDRFGSDLSLADLNGDGKADLTIGSSGENGREGSLHMLNGTATGVTVTGVRAFSSGTLGVQSRNAKIGSVVLH